MLIFLLPFLFVYLISIVRNQKNRKTILFLISLLSVLCPCLLAALIHTMVPNCRLLLSGKWGHNIMWISFSQIAILLNWAVSSLIWRRERFVVVNEIDTETPSQ